MPKTATVKAYLVTKSRAEALDRAWGAVFYAGEPKAHVFLVETARGVVYMHTSIGKPEWFSHYDVQSRLEHQYGARSVMARVKIVSVKHIATVTKGA